MAKTKRKASNSPAKSSTEPRATTSRITPLDTDNEVDTMRAMIRLFCWVQDDESDHAFEVKIADDESVSALKKVIKSEKKPEFNDFVADTLKIWKVSVP